MKRYDKIQIDQLEEYMKNGIDNFIVTEKDLYDQSKRIQLCDKYFYHAYTCQDIYQMELVKMSDDIIKRKGKLNIIMHLFNNKVISAKQAIELSDNSDKINDEFNYCVLHNKAIDENDQN